MALIRWVSTVAVAGVSAVAGGEGEGMSVTTLSASYTRSILHKRVRVSGDGGEGHLGVGWGTTVADCGTWCREYQPLVEVMVVWARNARRGTQGRNARKRKEEKTSATKYSSCGKVEFW